MGKVKQAFPFVEPADHESIKAYHTGMSLRDYFAANALVGICANPDNRCFVGAEKFADAAYKLADAMMEARK